MAEITWTWSVEEHTRVKYLLPANPVDKQSAAIAASIFNYSPVLNSFSTTLIFTYYEQMDAWEYTLKGAFMGIFYTK
jgi:hypothetical protein